MKKKLFFALVIFDIAEIVFCFAYCYTSWLPHLSIWQKVAIDTILMASLFCTIWQAKKTLM